MMANGEKKDGADKTAAEEVLASERQDAFTRRALIRAGWMVPVVSTVSIPSASAQTPAPHNDVHSDHTDHVDVPHTDTPPHTDVPHSDAPHSDTPHDDHADGPHSDVPHTD